MMNAGCLVVIPARGGSKRMPRKNIRLFLGAPIISYSIKAALNAHCFDEVMVSTDDQEIAEVAQHAGAQVPFFRSEQCSNDYSGIANVLEEVVLAYQKQGKFFDVICCILATAPFIKPERLKVAYELMQQSAVDAVVPVVNFGYPIQRSVKINNNYLEMFWPENYNVRSQDLEPAYHDVGQFYFIKTDVLLREKKLYVQRAVPLILPELEVQDIDNEQDWQVAELKYKILQQMNSEKYHEISL